MNETDALLRESLGFHILVELPILLVIVTGLTRGRPLWEVLALGVGVTLPSALSGAALCITIENRTASAAKLSILINMAVQIATVSAAFATGSASAVWVVRTVVIGATSALAFLLISPLRRRAALQMRLPVGLGSTFWRFALLSWLSGLVALLVFSRSEIFLLRAYRQKEALGLFALAFGISQQITAPADAMLHALIPAVAGVLSAWPDRAAAAFERSTRVSALACGGIAAFLVPPVVLAIPLIYGTGFQGAMWLFVPLAFISAFQSANNPILAFVNARQRGGLILKSYVAALVVDIGVAVLLIPRIGVWGAVAANVAGQTVALGCLIYTEPLARESAPRRLVDLYRAFLLGIGAGGLALAVGAITRTSSPPLAPIAAGVTGLTAYLVAVRLSRSGLTSKDREALLGAMASPVRRFLSPLLYPVTRKDPPGIHENSS